MSRSLLGFLSFCLVLLLASAGVVWYMGPSVAWILVDEQRRESPYHLLQLLPAVATRPDAAPSYRSRFLSVAAEDEGELVWEGGTVDVLEGSVLLDVAGVQLVTFPSGAELVQMLTSTAYRSLHSAFPGAVRHLGTVEAPEALHRDATSVLVLYLADPAAGSTPLGVPGESGWLALLPRYRGSLRWNAAIDPLRGAGRWNRLLLAQFPGTAEAEAWLTDSRTLTERAIARKRVDEMVVLLIQPSAAASR